MAVANLLPLALASAWLIACSPQLVDVVSGVSCCEDPTQEGCGGSAGRGSGGTNGSGGSVNGGTAGGGPTSAAVAPVHVYTFQGTGSAVVDSVGTANGALVGAELDGQGAVLLDISNDRYVELPSFILSGLKNATFEAWVTWNGGGPWQRIFDFGEDTTGVPGERGVGRSYLFCTPDDGTGRPKVTFGKPTLLATGMPRAAEPAQLAGNSAFPQGALTHVAVVVDITQDSISFFVNGGFQGSTEFRDSLDYVYNVNSWLGRSLYEADLGFNGTFHDFRIYNVALDANQILANYRRGI